MGENGFEQKEERLADLLIKILRERDFVIPAFLTAKEDGKIEECIDFIELNPEADDQDVWNFLLKDVPPIEIVDDEEE